MSIVQFFYSHIVKTFRNNLDTGEVSGAYIFSGLPGLGKTSLVKEICSIAKENKKNSDQHWVSTDNEKREISIEEIRTLKTDLYHTSASGGYKIVCINGVERLSNASGNALLKILEEPPKRTIFLLIDHLSRPVLPTIRSRSVIHSLYPYSENKIKKFLQSENVPQNKLDTVTIFAEGKPEEALLLAKNTTSLEEKSLSFKKTTDSILSTEFSFESFPMFTGSTQASWSEKQTYYHKELLRMKRVLFEAIKEKTGRNSLFSIIDRIDTAHSIPMHTLVKKIKTIINAERALQKQVPGGLLVDSLLL